MCRWFQYADDVGVISICHCCHGNQPRPICFRCHGNAPFRNNFFSFEHLQEVWDSCGILAAFCGFFWDSCGILLGFLRLSTFQRILGFFRDSCGFLGFFWDSFGILSEFLGLFFGFFWDSWAYRHSRDSAGLPKDSFGIPEGFLRFFGGDSFWILEIVDMQEILPGYLRILFGFFLDSWSCRLGRDSAGLPGDSFVILLWFFWDSWGCRHVRDSGGLPGDSFWDSLPWICCCLHFEGKLKGKQNGGHPSKMSPLLFTSIFFFSNFFFFHSIQLNPISNK